MASFGIINGQSLENLAHELLSQLDNVPTNCKRQVSKPVERAMLEIRALCDCVLLTMAMNGRDNASLISKSEQDNFRDLLLHLLDFVKASSPRTTGSVEAFSVSLGNSTWGRESLFARIVQLRLRLQRLMSDSPLEDPFADRLMEVPLACELPRGQVKRKRDLASHHNRTTDKCENTLRIFGAGVASHPPAREHLSDKAAAIKTAHNPTDSPVSKLNPSNKTQKICVPAYQTQAQTSGVTPISLKPEASHLNHTTPEHQISPAALNRQTASEASSSPSMLRNVTEYIPVHRESEGDLAGHGDRDGFVPDEVRMAIGLAQSKNFPWLWGSCGNAGDLEDLSTILNSLSLTTTSIHPTITILSWIYHAMRPLTMSELQEVLSIHDGDTTLQLDTSLEPHIILHLCHGLITCDETTDLVTFSHPQIRDLIRSKQFLDTEHLANTLLTYLSFDCFRHPCSDYRSLSNRLSKYRFANYAATYWPYYLKACDGDSAPGRKAFDLFGSRGRRSAILQMQSCDEGGRSSGYWIQNRSALHLYAQYGLVNLCQRVLTESSPTGLEGVLDYVDGEKRTPLHLAAMFGHLEVIELLVYAGADPLRGDSREMRPLHFASQNGHVDVVQALIAAESSWLTIHANEIVQPTRRWTPDPIDLAKKQGHADVVQALEQREQQEIRSENPMQDYMLALWSQESLSRGKFRMAKVNDSLPHCAKLPYWQDVRQYGPQSAHRLLFNYEARIEIWDGALPKVEGH